jgi:hypothetical protein
MKITILIETKTIKRTDICCFSGSYTPVAITLKPGEVIECLEISKGAKRHKGRKVPLSERIDIIRLPGVRLHPDCFTIPAANYAVE